MIKLPPKTPMLMRSIFFQRYNKLLCSILINLAVSSMISATNLTLYVLPRCPYCIKVERFIDEHDIKNIETKNIEDAANREELISIGGKKQVPCLVHDNKALYESDDIINWLKNNAIKA